MLLEGGDEEEGADDSSKKDEEGDMREETVEEREDEWVRLGRLKESVKSDFMSESWRKVE